MIECNINNITKQFGDTLIFENISFDIKTNERIGLIGPNGCGKTTIMKIIKGEEHANLGNVTFRKGTKLGYLDQIPLFSDDKLVIEILQDAFKDVYKLKNEIDVCLNSLDDTPEHLQDRVLNNYSNLLHEFELLSGYDVETNINKVCTGLKITETLKEMKFNLLSGGEKTRVMLGKILLESPSLLMLDEPSNHLDLESIEWLESYLKSYIGSVLIISHDRYFLDNVCQKIIELSLTKAYVYHGNYSYYVIERERRFLLEMKVYLAQEKKMKRMEDQIKQYRIWGVMRDSDKMFKRAKELEKRLAKVEKLDKPKHDNPKLKIKSGSISRSGKRVLEAKNISKSFEDLELLNDASLDLIYQDRLAILGSNGSGKTTLIKMFLEDNTLGEYSLYKWGSKINVGYLAQEILFDDDSISVLDYFMKEHSVTQPVARTQLAKALFIRDDVYKVIKHLSGGEKSKLKLCSLTYDEGNLMILDEPTNHLDIDSREVLEEILLEFTGTILFVSHDRYFIKKIANRVGEINDKKLIYYEGDYDYYKLMKSRIQKTEIKEKKKKPIRTKNKVLPKDNTFEELEKLDLEIEKINLQMANSAFDSEKLNELYLKKIELEAEYEILYSKLDI